MPQISQLAATYASQLFWLLLTFGLVFFVIGRGMAPRVAATIDARDKSVADDLAAAEAARKAADAAEESWRQHENAARESAQKLLGAARAKAAAETEKKLAKEGEKVAADLAVREADIAARSNAAMADIEAVAADAARDIVARLSTVTVSDAEATKAVKAVLNG